MFFSNFEHVLVAHIEFQLYFLDFEAFGNRKFLSEFQALNDTEVKFSTYTIGFYILLDS